MSIFEDKPCLWTFHGKAHRKAHIRGQGLHDSSYLLFLTAAHITFYVDNSHSLYIVSSIWILLDYNCIALPLKLYNFLTFNSIQIFSFSFWCLAHPSCLFKCNTFSPFGPGDTNFTCSLFFSSFDILPSFSYVPLLLFMDRETGSTLKHRCVSVLSVPITLVLLRKPMRHQQTNFNYLSIVVPPGPSQVSDIRAQCYSYGSVYLISFCTSWNIFVILTGCILSGREERAREREDKRTKLKSFCGSCTWQAGWAQQ